MCTRSTYICALCRLLETYLAVPTNSNLLIAICDGMCDVEKKRFLARSCSDDSISRVDRWSWPMVDRRQFFRNN